MRKLSVDIFVVFPVKEGSFNALYVIFCPGVYFVSRLKISRLVKTKSESYKTKNFKIQLDKRKE